MQSMKIKVDTLCSINEKSCRVCLDENPSSLISLFTQLGNETISAQLQNITSIDASENDCLPQYICIDKCFRIIKDACSIKTLSLETDKYLKKSLEALGIKQEPEVQLTEFDNVDLVLNNEQVFIKEETSDEHIDSDGPSSLLVKVKKIKKIPTAQPKKKIGRKRIYPIDESKQDQILKRYEARKLQRSQNREQDYTCLLCPGTNFQFRAYNKHMRDHELKNHQKPHKCGTCSREYYLVYQFNNHQCTVSQKCYICDTSCNSESLLTKHLQKDHRGLVLDCPICQVKHKSAKSLHFHLKGHSTGCISAFVCEICGKSFPGPGNLRNHQAVHTNSMFSCDICGVKIKNKFNVLRHMQASHLKVKFPCGDCEATFGFRDALKLHRIRKHGMEAPVKCSECLLGFVNNTALKIHVDGVHLKIRSKHNFSINQYRAGDFECDVCNRILTSKMTLKAHKNKHLGILNYKCSICAKGFTLKSVLTAHEATHNNIRNFKCAHCPSAFSAKSNMWKHCKSVHEKIRDHVCDICSKSFSFKTSLQVHRRTHTGVKPYRCDICETCSFSDPSTLYKHLKNIHKIAKPVVNFGMLPETKT